MAEKELEKAELNEEELDQVAGGSASEEELDQVADSADPVMANSFMLQAMGQPCPELDGDQQ